MRVVMVGDFPRDIDSIGGGVESVMSYLCAKLAEEGDLELHAVTVDRWGLGEREIDFGSYTAHFLAQPAVRGPLRRLINIRNLRDKIRQLHPNIVHAHIAGQYSEAAHDSGFPYVLTLHGVRYLEARLKKGFIDRVYRRHLIRYEERKAIRRAPNVISINSFIDECFPGEFHGRIERIENPIADSWFDIEQDGNSLGLLYAGRITPRKDILTLLKAFRVVHARFPNATLRIAGAPDDPDKFGYFDEMKAFVTTNGLDESVRFLGNLSEHKLRSEYAQNAVFVIAAVLETAPMSIAQAQAAGRLIVATDAGGCRHMVKSGESGFIVEVGDHEAFARQLLTCLDNPQLAKNMRDNTRKTARSRYRATLIARKTKKFYEEIVEAS
jgi:glycosyltransferase involved in cell wall biosynthesis